MRRRIITEEELDRPKVKRVIVILVAGTLIAGVAAWLAGVDVRDELRERDTSAATRAVDPLRTELLRCNGLGQAALDDALCRDAWAENRRRFFGSPDREAPRVNETQAASLADDTPSAPEPVR
jgi:conjugative transfer region protein TrbK